MQELNNIDFIDDEYSIKPTSQLMTNLGPQQNIPCSQGSLPREILKSTTVESLLSQNEDLMARLKVTLRRLSILEIENQKITEESQKIQNHFSTLTDQNLVFKEKEFFWKSKIDDLEKQADQIAQQLHITQNKMTKTTAELERYKKYHEKIKTNVKPFISDLKARLFEVQSKYDLIRNDSVSKEALIRDLRHQMNDLVKNYKEQLESTHNKNSEMVDFYEEQTHKLSSELKAQLELNKTLEAKSIKLNKVLERHDELQNEVIYLTRHKDEIKKQLEDEIVRLQDKANIQAKQLIRHNLENKDLSEKAIRDEKELREVTKAKEELENQIENLRYMWNSKNQENEMLKSALSALEKLNVNLSQKLQEKNI